MKKKTFIVVALVWAVITAVVCLSAGTIDIPSSIRRVTDIILSDYTYIVDGGFNNVIRNARAETGTTSDWATYADAAGATPVDCTGGSPNTTWIITSGAPIYGTKSFLMTKTSGASRRGEGISYAFSIPVSYESLNINLSFAYAGNANYTSGAAVVYIYDVTNSTLITPTTTSIPTTATNTASYFRTSFLATTSRNYRACIHIASAVNSDWAIKFDDFKVGWHVTSQDFAKESLPGVVNNNSSNTIGTPILGVTNGVAASGNYLGEQTTLTSTGYASIVSAAGTYGNQATITLGAGAWILYGTMSTNNNGAVTAQIVRCGWGVTTGDVVPVQESAENVIATTGLRTSVTPLPMLVNPSTSTSYYFKVRADTSVTNLQASVDYYAVRIR